MASAFNTSEPQYVKATIIDGPGPSRPYNFSTQNARTASSPLQGIAKIAGGAAIAMAGISMLILPGPGLLAIGGGIALAWSGVNDLMGR